MSGLLVITAHPDDEVLIAGGLLAACAQAGVPTGVVCLTRGENGPIADPALATRETLAAVREHELREACAELGVNFVKCYRREDGSLRWSDTSGIAAQLARVIDRREPEVVVTFGEDGLYYHPDHITAYDVSRRAIERSASRPALYRALWLTADVRELMTELRRRGLAEDLWGLDPNDFGVEAQPAGAIRLALREFTAQKLRAVRCHRTQLSEGHALAKLPDDVAERFLGYERFALVDAPVPARPAPAQNFFDRLAQVAAPHG